MVRKFEMDRGSTRCTKCALCWWKYSDVDFCTLVYISCGILHLESVIIAGGCPGVAGVRTSTLLAHGVYRFGSIIVAVQLWLVAVDLGIAP